MGNLTALADLDRDQLQRLTVALQAVPAEERGDVDLAKLCDEIKSNPAKYAPQFDPGPIDFEAAWRARAWEIIAVEQSCDDTEEAERIARAEVNERAARYNLPSRPARHRHRYLYEGDE